MKRLCKCGCEREVSKRAKAGFVRGHNTRMIPKDELAKRANVASSSRIVGKDERRRRNREYMREYREKNREKLRESGRRWARENREKVLESQTMYRYRNGAKPKVRGRSKSAENDLRRVMYSSDPEYRERILRIAESGRRARGVQERGLSGPERVVEAVLNQVFGEWNVIRGDRSTVLNEDTGWFLELDFLVPVEGVAVEVQGPRHFIQIFEDDDLDEVRRRDEIKRAECERLGIRLIEVVACDGKHYDRKKDADMLRSDLLNQL